MYINKHFCINNKLKYCFSDADYKLKWMEELFEVFDTIQKVMKHVLQVEDDYSIIIIFIYYKACP